MRRHWTPQRTKGADCRGSREVTHEKKNAPDSLPPDAVVWSRGSCQTTASQPGPDLATPTLRAPLRLQTPANSMSSSRASSSSPEPEIVSTKTKKSKDKSKKVKHAHPAAEPDKHGRNEGEDASLAYKPPEGYVLMKHSAEETEFDWDAINNNDNLELWVVRVPDGVSPVPPTFLRVALNALRSSRSSNLSTSKMLKLSSPRPPRPHE